MENKSCDLPFLVTNFSITDIVKGGKFRYPNSDWGENFFREKLKSIDRQLIGTDISYTETQIQWQHRLTFINSKGERAVISLWYGNKGYTRKITIIFGTSPSFVNICYNICNQWSDAPVPMPHTLRKYAIKLYQFVNTVISELDIQLINFREADWMDIFYLKTDGQAVVQFIYNSSMLYTILHPMSSIGYDDKKLILFCKKFECDDEFIDSISN